jgi:hypothetical protein
VQLFLSARKKSEWCIAAAGDALLIVAEVSMFSLLVLERKFTVAFKEHDSTLGYIVCLCTLSKKPITK